jgi:hypothetical protein
VDDAGKRRNKMSFTHQSYPIGPHRLTPWSKFSCARGGQNWNELPFGRIWLTFAIPTGGFARTRYTSASTWFLLTAFFGPFAAFLLVKWPPRALVRTSPAEIAS